jgi:thiol-disulfide isomerase/thioredoxin
MNFILLLLLALLAVGVLVAAIGSIVFVVAAFRAHVGWGIAVLLVPLAGLAFLITHWPEARKGFWIQMLGMALMISGLGIAFVTMGEEALRQVPRRAHMPAIPQLPRALTAAVPRLAGGAAHPTGTVAVAVSPGRAPGRGDAAVAPPGSPPAAELMNDPQTFVGRSLADVKAAMGPPKGRMMVGQRTCLLYDGVSVFSDDGMTVATIQFDLKPPVPVGKDKPAAAAPPARPKAAAGPASNPSPPSPAKGDAGKVEPIKTLANGGQRLDLSSVPVPGKVTMVDFYADWCGPCRALSPQLEDMVRKDPDVTLRKVDIVKWDTDVCKQFDIRSVPNVRVFDRRGRMVGTPSYDAQAIAGFVQQAK